MTGSHTAKLAAHLTERDRNIAFDCYQHNVLTTDQLRRLHFRGLRTTTVRLQMLYDLHVLDRFRPQRNEARGPAPITGYSIKQTRFSSLTQGHRP